MVENPIGGITDSSSVDIESKLAMTLHGKKKKFQDTAIYRERNQNLRSKLWSLVTWKTN